MAIGSVRPCTYPGCPNTQKASRCDLHKFTERKASDKGRPSRHERGYTNRWAKYAKTYLESHPVCAIRDPKYCTERATEVDHIVPHRGDHKLFWNPKNHQPACHHCHSAKTAREDGRWGQGGKRGGASRPTEWVTAAMLPPNMGRPVIPLIVVAGPPGAGKTEFVKRHAGERDLVLDLDELLVKVTRRPLYSPASDEEWNDAKRLRNKFLLEICSASRWTRAWMIASAPRLTDRRFWRDHGARVVMLTPSLDTCLRRIRGDGRRGDVPRHEEACLFWWKIYTSSGEDEIVADPEKFHI